MVNYRAPTNIRFPPDLHKDIKKIAEQRGVSFAQIVIEACYQYIDGSVPGLCPSCHIQNDPDAQYCQKCGSPLTEEAKLEQNMFTRISLDPKAVKTLYERMGVDHIDEINETTLAMNTIFQLQKQIDELQSFAEWAKKKMKEESKNISEDKT